MGNAIWIALLYSDHMVWKQMSTFWMWFELQTVKLVDFTNKMVCNCLSAVLFSMLFSNFERSMGHFWNYCLLTQIFHSSEAFPVNHVLVCQLFDP